MRTHTVLENEQAASIICQAKLKSSRLLHHIRKRAHVISEKVMKTELTIACSNHDCCALTRALKLVFVSLPTCMEKQAAFEFRVLLI